MRQSARVGAFFSFFKCSDQMWQPLIHLGVSALSSGLRNWWRDGPLTHRTRDAAVQTLCHGKLRAAIGTGRLRGEGIEPLSAFGAHPESARGRSGVACWTSKVVIARRTGGAGKRARMEQSAKAIEQDKP